MDTNYRCLVKIYEVMVLANRELSKSKEIDSDLEQFKAFVDAHATLKKRPDMIYRMLHHLWLCDDRVRRIKKHILGDFWEKRSVWKFWGTSDYFKYKQMLDRCTVITRKMIMKTMEFEVLETIPE